MVDSASGTPISGRDVIEKVLNEGVESVNTEQLSNETGFDSDAGQVVQSQVDRASWGQTGLPTDNWTKVTTDSPLFQPTDVTSDGVFCADVFAVTHEGRVYLIFEHDTGDTTPDIAISSSPDGKTNWTHHGIVIADDTRSQPFPHTVLYQGTYYCITNQSGPGEAQLWKTSYSDFPTGWTQVWNKTIQSGTVGGWDESIKDVGMVFWNGKFWIVYAGGAGSGDYGYIGAKFSGQSGVENPTFQDAAWSGMRVSNRIQGFIPLQYGNNLQFTVNAAALSDQARVLTAETFTRNEVDLYQHQNPTVTTGATGSWDDTTIHHTAPPIRVGDTWHMYYDGHDGDGEFRLGLATMEAEV